MPTNRETAAFLRRLAALLDLEGVARSRPKILREAAAAIEEADCDVGLDQIEDETVKVGEEPRRELEAFFANGSTALADELSAKYPAGLLDIVAVPGIGASRARALHEDLGVDSLEKLVAAGEEGSLTSIRGIGARSADKIVAAARALIEEGRQDAAAEPIPEPAAASKSEAAPIVSQDDGGASDAAGGTDDEMAADAVADPEDDAVAPTTEVAAEAPEAVVDRAEAAEQDSGAVEAGSDVEPSETTDAGTGLDDPLRQDRILDEMRELTGEADSQAQEAEVEAQRIADAAAKAERDGAAGFLASLRCMACHATGLSDHGRAVECGGCGKRYIIENGVVDFLVVSSRPSLAQRLMEYGPYANVYENIARPMATKLVTSRTIEEEIELAADLLALGISGNKQALVLDVACGPGNFTRRFGERVERHGGFVVGLDASWAMLGQAVQALERRGDRNVRYVRGDAGRLPFGDASVDAVHCAGALHLMRGVDGVLQEFARVLKPGGVVVIGTFVLGRNPVARMFKRATGRGVGFRWFDRRDLKERLGRVGLDVAEESIEGAALTLKAVRAKASE